MKAIQLAFHEKGFFFFLLSAGKTMNAGGGGTLTVNPTIPDSLDTRLQFSLIPQTFIL